MNRIFLKFKITNNNMNTVVKFTEKSAIAELAPTKDEVRFVKYKARKSLVFEEPKLAHIVNQRNQRKVYHNGKEVTPKNLLDFEIDQFDAIADNKLIWTEKTRTSFAIIEHDKDVVEERVRTLSMVYDIDVIMSQFEEHTLEEPIEKPSSESFKRLMPNFIKIKLAETANFVYFEQPSVTVLKGSEEAAIVEEDNKRYEALCTGKAANRRRSEAETQTPDVLYKSRSSNTEIIKSHNIDTFVSNYDMYDTYEELERTTNSIENGTGPKLEITTYGGADSGVTDKLSSSESFRLSSMVIERLLAGNVFEDRQKRYRNMYPPSPLDANAKYLYRINILWTYKMNELLGKAVSCSSWCHKNSDIIAIGYGIYNFVPHESRRDGLVCIWNIKNPVNPERRYRFSVPVTSLCFSKKNPQLLAVGLFDGTVTVIDITVEDVTPIAKSHRSTSPGFEPVWEICWIQGKDLFEINEQLLAILQDGRIMKYSFITGPYLLGFEQLYLNRVEGVIEGIPVVKKREFIEASRHPQAICLLIHPVKTDDYFVGTDEGCLYRSSINYPHQHKMQVHNGGVYAIDFSPWSPKIFLTCGSDWFIRIWVDGIFEPICEFCNGHNAVQYACWSPINPTVFACVTKTRLEIWDIKRKTQKPASVHRFASGAVPLTILRFTKCGRALIVGDEEGTTYVCALEDMPFPPHYPYMDLQSALYKLMDADPERLKQVQSLGHLGY